MQTVTTPRQRRKNQQSSLQDVTKTFTQPRKVVTPEEILSSICELEQTQEDQLESIHDARSSESSEESDDEDLEQDFREHCRHLFANVGVAATQSYFDIEKKKRLARETAKKVPVTKKRKLNK
jgi:hypothetical protein